MPLLSELPAVIRAHWRLHLDAALRDNLVDERTVEEAKRIDKEIKEFLKDKNLPNIKHLAHIHNWLEYPDRRSEMEIRVEVLDG